MVHAVTMTETAAAWPSCGVFSTAVKGQVSTSPRDIPYGENRIIVRWNKSRWRCRETTNAVPSPSPSNRSRPWRSLPGSVVEVATVHGVSWPTAHRAFVANAKALLAEP
ncbi:MAG: transposase [Mycobacterium sp.]|nr:transposase [Mycobacterium sp.]